MTSAVQDETELTLVREVCMGITDMRIEYTVRRDELLVAPSLGRTRGFVTSATLV